MPVVKATFDGQVFVPCDPVEAEKGTLVEVIVPPRKPTVEETRQWQEILATLRSSESPWPTLEEAMRAMRKYP